MEVSLMDLNNPRALRGLAILSKGDTVTTINDAEYRVKSQTGEGEYRVWRDPKNLNWNCTCPDFKKQATTCKHAFAVLYSRRLRAQAEYEAAQETPRAPSNGAEAPIPNACPKCGGSEMVRDGLRKTKNGVVQRFLCQPCGFRFTVDRGFSRMKTEPKAITAVVDLYFKGVSIRKIQDHLKQFYGITVSTATPLLWIRKYLKLLSAYAEQQKPKVGEFWHVDEMTANVREKGKENNYEWVWNLMDSETRFLLACRISKTRYAKDARKPLEDAKRRTGERPKFMVTDGLQAYQEAVSKAFYDKRSPIHNPHIRLSSFETKPNNNILERLNGTVRERLKVMRGFDAEATAGATLEGWRFYYNYVRPHMGLDGMTPAQAATITVPTEGNRWMSLIENAKRATSPATKQGVRNGSNLP
ncbi:MAG: DDE-type integrase/transposase/recombinase [Euryarchaeota archaeon]|nr:DDE-type integrase/transposase/recombinase [Euryarchaeota archaeon]